VSKSGISLHVDISKFGPALDRKKLTRQNMLDIRGAGARIVINKQRELVPVDTGATRASINSHIIEATEKRVVDEIGPETDYAPFIEFGTSNPNYPIQPFVRPSIEGSNASAIRNAMETCFKIILGGR